MERKDPEIDAVQEAVLNDRISKYADVKCPIHGGPPVFEPQPDGSVVERICCDVLAQIVRELKSSDPDKS